MHGIIGKGSAPKSVIEASLFDLGTDVEYVVPWYGKPSAGLEAVYDWLLDNEVDFSIMANGTTVPKALRSAARAVWEEDDTDRALINMVVTHGGMALVMWDEDDEDTSVKLASLAIERGVPTLELTNGMVPIIFSEDPQPEEAPASQQEPEEDMSFDRPTLENMPAAVVKRMAKEKGLDAKTRDDAITQLMGELVAAEPGADRTIQSVVITFSDGTVIKY